MTNMTKFQKGGVRILALFTVLAVLLMTLSFVSSTKATALTAAKDTISDSDLSATAVTHTITFTTATALVDTDMIDITFPAGFTTIVVDNVTCPTNSTAGVDSQVVTCTVGAEGVAAGAQTVTITGVTNPGGSASSYTINIVTENASEVEIESVDVMVAIIDDVTVTATVSSTLTFTVAAVTEGTAVNTDTTTITSTATTIPFSTLTAGTEAIGGHTLTVKTNADDGFVVTVQQDDDLTSAGASVIDCFKDGTAQTTPDTWASPTGTLGTENTYGHFGFTSEDDLNDDEFSGPKYAGFDDTTADEVFSNDGPADGSTADQGSTKVGYKVEIDELQEAGDYTNTLTYICTPTY